MKNNFKKLSKNNGKLGFDYNGTFITNCFMSECKRFDVEPIKYYDLTQNQVNLMIEYNKLK